VDMRYNVAQLLKGPTGGQRRYEVEEDIRDIDPDLRPLGPLKGSVTLMRTSQGILVTGRLRTVIEGECRRCLEPAKVKVELELEEEFYPTVAIAESPVDPVPDEEYDEALTIDEHHMLDLGEVVRQGLWLATPMDALCRLDCAGLCPRCGGNRNLGECTCEQDEIDPRWAVLQTLLAAGDAGPEETESDERSE
jgi:uncharacterized protein